MVCLSSSSCFSKLPTPGFILLEAGSIGIDFRNNLPYTDALNPYTYKSFFNGGGVAIGDLNGDNLPDIILTGNFVDNGIYINRGDWTFEDITQSSGLAGARAWNSGVTLADVNGDGLLDVYLCKSGLPGGPNRRNELRINQGDGTFLDVASEVGLDELGFSIQGVFFDYDRDGDLDMYLLSNSIRSTGGYDLRPSQRELRDTAGGNKLFRNLLVEEGRLRFDDVSEASGIYGSSIGFGLGVAVGDINGDLWPDLYVSNDFFERDYLYVNKGGVAGFDESLLELVPETATGAMGADMADVTGDGAPEIFVSEMLPSDPKRYRSKTVFETWATRATARSAGYGEQFGRNVLLTNDGTGRFAETGRQLGVEATDWSWGALFADLDDDGWRDLYIANGTFKDPLDQDYLRRVANDQQIRQWIREGGEVVRRLIDSMPSSPQPNVAYHNLHGSGFADSTVAWGLDVPSFSNGSAYGDLDGDGDLDLVVNVANSAPLLYRNDLGTGRPQQHRSITVSLRDTLSVANRFAIGSRVEVYTDNGRQVAEAQYAKGFLSSVEPQLHFGLGDTRVDSVVVYWSSGGREVAYAPATKRLVQFTRTLGGTVSPAEPIAAGTDPAWREAPWSHRESRHDDGERYPFLPEMHSAEGPAFAVSSPGGRGSRLVFVGGAKDYSSAIVSYTPGGGWGKLDTLPFADQRSAEHVEAVWVDLDSDGDEDLVVGCGGDEYPGMIGVAGVQVYRRNADGRLTFDPGAVGSFTNGFASGALVSFDADGDGDPDLFVGTHFPFGAFGTAAPSMVLLNDGTGRFSPAPASPAFNDLDRVKAAIAVDLDGDGVPELVTAQEFGPVSIFVREGGQWLKRAAGPHGLWQSLAVVPTASGGFDIIAGNHGLNSRLRGTPTSPLVFWQVDIDGNGAPEQFLAAGPADQDIPLVQLPDLLARVPVLRKRFTRFKAFAKTTTADLVGAAKPLRRLRAEELRSGVLRWDRVSDTLTFEPLPPLVQRTTLRAIAIQAEVDANPIVYCAGNYSYVKPEYGGQHSGRGVALRYVPTSGAYAVVPNEFPYLVGEVRALAYSNNLLFAGRNNAPPCVTNLSPLQ